MKYIDADKLTKAIEDKGLDCSFILKMERLDTLALIDELRVSEDKRRAKELIKALQSGYYDGYQHGKEDAQKEQKSIEWKPQPESLEALMYAIEGKWDAIPPTSYLSRRLEDLYEGLVNTFNVDESLLAELPKVASRADTAEGIEELRELKHKIEASMEQKPNIEICPHSIKSKSYHEEPEYYQHFDPDC